MLDLIGILAYLLFATATATLVWAVGVLVRSAEANGECPTGTNPHSWRF